MATTTYTKALPTVTKTTMALQVGDIVQEGNCISGFWTWTVAAVTENVSRKSMPLVTMLFEHGGQGATPYGKNSRWSVVKVGA